MQRRYKQTSKTSVPASSIPRLDMESSRSRASYKEAEAVEEPEDDEAESTEPHEARDLPAGDGDEQAQEEDYWQEDAWQSNEWYADWSWWQSGDWQHHDWQSSVWSSDRQPRASTKAESWSSEVVELLPSFVQGWFLLQDAGLEAHERNLVMTALKNDFSVERVAQELRNQWPDHDLRGKDQGHRGSAWTVDQVDEEEPEPAGVDLSCLVQEGMNDEGLMIMEEAEESAQEAMALMDKGRRTLREARAKQHQVKMSRQYYRVEQKSMRPPFTRSHRSFNDQGIRCLKCGTLGHKVAQCPERNKEQPTASATPESAPFVCFAEQCWSDPLTGMGKGNVDCSAADSQVLKSPDVANFAEPATAHVVGEGVTSEQAMLQGKAILDGGATRSIGSVTALEKLMELNQNQKGRAGLKHVDGDQCPTFGFGNSSSDRCLSTAWIEVAAGGREGELKIHTLDRGNSPILFSIEALRSLGAIIDCKEDLVVFRSLDATRVIELERSCTGHQLLPLVEDWFTQSKQAKTAIPSLKAFLE